MVLTPFVPLELGQEKLENPFLEKKIPEGRGTEEGSLSQMEGQQMPHTQRTATIDDELQHVCSMVEGKEMQKKPIGPWLIFRHPHGASGPPNFQILSPPNQKPLRNGP